MYDLVGAYERIHRVYRMYIESAFPLRYDVLSEERQALLSSQQVLAKAPVLETTPVYQSSGLNLAAASTQLPPDYRDLHKLACELMPPDQQLYNHQWRSLYQAIVHRRDIVVTT